MRWKPMAARVMFWDWKSGPDITELAKIVREMSADGQVHLTEVPNTGMDAIGVVFARQPLTPAEADEKFRIYLEESND